MRIDSCTMREIRLSLKSPFRTSFEVTHHRRILLIELRSEGVVGWGEVTASEGPYFNSEATDTAWITLAQFLIPAIVGKTIESPSDIAVLLAPVRGHEMAKAALENAAWDIEAQQMDLSLSQLLGGTLTHVGAGVSLGIQKSSDVLLPIVEKELAAGYRRIKLKIEPGNDIAAVRAVRDRFPSTLLSVDANSAYTLNDLDTLRDLDQYDLLMMEQPLAWDEIYQHAALQAQLQTAICLDECIRSRRDAAAALAMEACRIVNIKLGRVGGHTEARAIERLCRERSIPVWCGGMFESGIGRAHNIALSSLPGFVLPGDVSASKRYWIEDIIEPEVEVSPDGFITVPTTPGLGYAVRTERVEELTVRRESWSRTAFSASAANGAESL